MHSEFWLTADVFTKYFHCRSPLCWIPADAENKMKIIIIHLHNLIIKKYRSIYQKKREEENVYEFFSLLVGWLLLGAKCERAKILFRGFPIPLFHFLYQTYDQQPSQTTKISTDINSRLYARELIAYVHAFNFYPILIVVIDDVVKSKSAWKKCRFQVNGRRRFGKYH